MRVIRGRFGWTCIRTWYQPMAGLGWRRDVVAGTRTGRTVYRAWKRAHRATMRRVDDGQVVVV